MWLNATVLNSAALENNISEEFALFFYQLSEYSGFAGF